MDEEMKAIERNETWDLTALPKDHEIVSANLV